MDKKFKGARLSLKIVLNEKDIRDAIKNYVGYGITDDEIEEAYCKYFYDGGVNLKAIKFIEIDIDEERK